MKRRHFSLLVLLYGLTAGAQSQLSPRFRTVYIVPMPNSMNEYLASRITSRGVLWVVLQPSSADAVLTDTLNENFWTWLDRSYNSPAGAAPAAPPEYNRASPAYYPHAGTLFLVDPRRRIVLWSIYDLPKNSSPTELDRTASRVVNQLKAAFGKKQ